MKLEEAIERLKHIDMTYGCNNYYSNYDLDCIGTVLQALEDKDKESHFIQSELDKANAEIIELKKMVDLMANAIAREERPGEALPTNAYCHPVSLYMSCENVGGSWTCEECVKAYFEDKAYFEREDKQ